MLRSLGTKAYLALALGLLFGLLSIVVVILVNMTMKRQALTDAEQAARMLLDHNLAIHTYFTKDLKPKLFEHLGPTASKDYFEPAWMSSTYAVRKMDGYFRHFNQSPYYYKESAINARSPENEADAYEKSFLEDLQNNPQLTTKSDIRVLDGKPYFTLLRRGEAMEESCLRCHSSPEQAPGDMVRHYGPERSFHRKVQDVAQAISIRIPVSEAFSTATSFSFHLSGLLLLALGCGFLFVWIGTKKLLIGPMAEIQKHAVRIASEPEHLGETIPEPKVRELSDLVVAFNKMSVELRRTYDEQEQRILERTKELVAANRQLENEAESRLKAARALLESEKTLKGILATSPVGIGLTVNREVKWANETWEKMFGFENEDEYVGQDARILYPSEEEYNRVGELYPNLRAGFLAETDARMKRKDGSVFDANIRMNDLDPNDQDSGTIAAISDISQRKQAEVALRQEKERARQYLDIVGTAVIAINTDQTVSLVNQAGCRLLGYSEEEILGKNWFDTFLPERMRDDVKKVFSQLIAGIIEPVRYVEGAVLSRTGEERIVAWHNMVIRDETGTITGTLSSGPDITERERAERALRESEERFRKVFEQGPLGVAILTLDYRWESVNARLCEMLGYSEDELLKLTFIDITHPDDIEADLELSNRLLRGEIPVKKTAKRYIKKNGETLWISLTAALARDEHGQPIYFLGMIEDISERTRAEEALMHSEELYRSLFENMLNGFAYCQMHFDDQDRPCDFTYLTVNNAFETLTGLRDVAGKRVSEVIPGIREADPELIEIYGRVARSGRPERFEMFVESLQMWFSISVYSPEREYFVVLFHVITERKRAEELLRTTLQRFYTILSSLYAGVLIVTEEGRVEFANQAFCNLFDLNDPPESLYGLAAPEMIARIQDVYAQPAEAVARIREVVEKRRPVKGEQIAMSRGRTYMRDYVPLFVDGKGTGRLWYHNDITYLKKAEEERESLKDQLLQAQKMEAIGTLTGGIAHDFNNLLTVINGFTEMILMEKTEDDPNYADLQKILQTGRKGADMVQRLLSFTKHGAPNLEPIDLNQRIEEGKKLMEATFPKIIRIETILAADLASIKADAGQIDQVFMNLCVNAKDAMPDGGRLRIETRNTIVDEDYCKLNIQAKPGRYILVEVADTGVGMSTETMARIFDPFFTTKGWDFRKGTGLGLPVVKGIVEQHGGWITCRSELGKGTTFAVWFPVIDDSRPVHKPEPPAEPVLTGEMILLVDDEEFIRDLGKRILERSAYTVVIAANGKEALDIYTREQSRIALVVLDMVMPEMEGKQCLDSLLKINPQVKVIISSGFSLDAEEREHLGAFVSGFVNKPYEARQLVQAVREALKSGVSTGS